eukprot:gnl/TRDRNA2_/TRDRNA2_44222_c0_seq1.p1 gnl/TRDRNA2_/TRDRNA2_44222_c0~~gnl/TRDRNA2_/TRDRNA2_44222_c0_seq1.p1  ORF type:complete len:652 (+),score=131.59 gnl/TRDRNA2_/TRDRNA2_44222_c0_seq1:93-2048(+)
MAALPLQAIVSMGWVQPQQFCAPKGVGNDPPSVTQRTVTLKISGSDETLTLPIFTCTKVLEVKTLLESRLGLPEDTLRFAYKCGCSWRQHSNVDEIARMCVVRGIESFQRPKKKYTHPHVVIGAGHIGLKVAMTWIQDKFDNFIVFDRMPKVGGTSWWKQANKTSRLQTEVGVYHLQYHENNDWPEWAIKNPWPSREKLLEHFDEQATKWGIHAYCRMETNCTSTSVIGKDYWNYTYEVTHEKDGHEEVTQCSSIMFFPGNLTNPKRVEYKGEDNFDGPVVYGISSNFDYGFCKGKKISIIGSGAFAVENVRTCVEEGASKVVMICRRKTIAMPRVVSWFINQSAQFISAALTLDTCKPMYDLINVDVWDYYAVFGNQARTTATIRQKSRFGIGDVYFLSKAMGHTEHLVDDVKRVSEHKIHLVSGNVVEDVRAMLKLLGFNGEFDNDRLLKIKEMYGWWPNADFRKYIVAEPIGVDANNFGGTSFSPGAISWSEQQIHLLYYPKDFAVVRDSQALPTHKADESIDRPAYVVEARFGSMLAITISSLVPGIGERGAITGPIKRERMWQMHPADKFLEAARLEWDMWSEQIRSLPEFKDQEHIPYPYTLEKINTYLELEFAAYGGRAEQQTKQAELDWQRKLDEGSTGNPPP